MITIITGTPGAGKTAYTVAQLLEMTDRPIFVDGIPDLKIPHEVAPPVDQWVTVVDDAESGATSLKWNFPPNSIIIMDEAQRGFRPRPAGSKVPAYVAALETHRHAGLDFWFITQHPALLEQNVRRLCGRHIHLRSTALGRRLHEWTQVEDPESAGARANAVTRPYTLPKEAFSRYKSAEVHTKQSRRLPASMYVVIVAVLAFATLGWFGYKSVSSKMAPAEVAKAPLANEHGHEAPASYSRPQVATSADDLLQEFVPRIPTRPETAPAFDGMRQVKAMPVLSYCMESARGCNCYTQQGSKVPVLPEQCRAFITAPPFNPYQEDPPLPAGKEDKPEAVADKSPSKPRAHWG